MTDDLKRQLLIPIDSPAPYEYEVEWNETVYLASAKNCEFYQRYSIYGDISLRENESETEILSLEHIMVAHKDDILFTNGLDNFVGRIGTEIVKKYRCKSLSSDLKFVFREMNEHYGRILIDFWK